MQGDTLPFFASLCLFLSSIEYAVPKPLPFMRLGLANLPVIFAVKSFRFRDILLLITLKVLLSSFISGTMFSYVFLFSAAGSLASGLAVFFLYSCLKRFGIDRHISNLGLCLAGALANNAAQIAVARALIFGRQAYVIAPLLLVSGLVSGLALGIFANKFEAGSFFLKSVREGGRRTLPAGVADGKAVTEAGAAPGTPGGLGKGGQGNAADTDDGDGDRKVGLTENDTRKGGPVQILLAALALILMLALPFLPSFRMKAAAWLVLLVLDEAARKGKVRLIPSVIMIASLTALSLLSPSGKVLHVIGSLRITQGAIETGLSKGLTLTGMLFASQTVFAALRSRGLGQRGSFGRIFADFARLSERGLDIKGRGLIAALDGRLLDVWHGHGNGTQA